MPKAIHSYDVLRRPIVTEKSTMLGGTGQYVFEVAKEANKKRQQDIREETDKLFQLATELKAAVDKSNENLLSLDVVRKADEVEKLAKKVKEKMKESVGPPVKQEIPTPVPAYPH